MPFLRRFLDLVVTEKNSAGGWRPYAKGLAQGVLEIYQKHGLLGLIVFAYIAALALSLMLAPLWVAWGHYFSP